LHIPFLLHLIPFQAQDKHPTFISGMHAITCPLHAKPAHHTPTHTPKATPKQEPQRIPTAHPTQQRHAGDHPRLPCSHQNYILTWPFWQSPSNNMHPALQHMTFHGPANISAHQSYIPSQVNRSQNTKSWPILCQNYKRGLGWCIILRHFPQWDYHNRQAPHML
jgi:hypothetical protein